ncbi:hypothetical protein ACVBAX_16275 [Robertmurraya sp. GLU-23]
MRIRIFLVVLFISIILGACSKENTTTKQEDKKKDIDTEETTERKEVSSESNDSEQVQKSEEPSGMEVYRPKVGIVKTFVVEEDNSQTYTEEYVYENEEYIQKVTRIGQAITVQVYRWTEKEISLVFEDREPVDPYKNYLTDLKVNNPIDIYYKDGESSWELVDTDQTVSVPSGKYTGVILFKKVTNEVEGADTIYKNYFAPGLGLIIEEFELTGEQGYSAKSVLKLVETK